MKKITQEEFLKRAALINPPFSLENFVYSGSTVKSLAVCPSHGNFYISPSAVLRGTGCPKCGVAKRAKGRQMSFEAFVKASTEKHNGLYTYSEKDWVGGKTKINLRCPVHDIDFTQTAHLHALGRTGCSKCESEKSSATQSMPQEKFIEKCKRVHGNLYDLSLVRYKNSASPVTIVCKKHGEFSCRAGNFIHRKSGCPKCAYEKNGERNRHTLEAYLPRFEAAHGDAYTYKQVVFRGKTSYVHAVCKVHGDFKQTVQDHIRGIGCKKCSFKLWDQASFLAEAKKVHGDTYDYSKTKYVKSTEKVTITCRIHGDFLQEPNYHINSKQGCRSCGLSGPSAGQIEVYQFLSTLVPCETDYRFDGRKELDVYLPTLNLAVEYNGLIWHSTKFSKSLHHLAEKSELAASKGIRVLHIYSDEWEHNKKAVEELLTHAVGLSTKIYARDTSWSLVNKADADLFLNSHHLRGAVPGESLDYGLFDSTGELVSVMSFSRLISHQGVARDAEVFELRRFASTCAVVGGASKLFKRFLADHPETKRVITYSENRLFTGKVYETLGFKHTADIPPDYWYVRASSKKRYNKAQFRRSKLQTILGDDFDPNLSEVSNCVRAGWFRLFDCGKKRWEFKP